MLGEKLTDRKKGIISTTRTSTTNFIYLLMSFPSKK